MRKNTQIFIFYKNKVLLTTSAHPFEQELWSVVSTKIFSDTSKSTEIEEISRLVKSKLGLGAFSVVPLAQKEHVFFIKLSDENVNSMKRTDSQRLEFYNISEIPKLALTDETRDLFTNFKENIDELARG